GSPPNRIQSDSATAFSRIKDPEHLPVKLFSTAYHNSNITRLQLQGINRHAVFLVTESEAITYNYELGLLQTSPKPDSRIAHTLNLKFDAYGRALQSVAVVYPRQVPYDDPTNPLKTEQRDLIRNVQNERHIAYAETHFTAELTEDPDRHRLRAKSSPMN
ncbi:MAG: toxin TcdB middle/C-terminal domain-containing protein, partial [Nitrospirota bacterium]